LNNVNTTTLTTATAMVEDQCPPCCTKTNGEISEYLIPATLRLRNNATVHVLIDTALHNVYETKNEPSRTHITYTYHIRRDRALATHPFKTKRWTVPTRLVSIITCR